MERSHLTPTESERDKGVVAALHVQHRDTVPGHGMGLFAMDYVFLPRVGLVMFTPATVSSDDRS